MTIRHTLYTFSIVLMIVMGSLNFSRSHFPASSTFKTVAYKLKSFKVLGRETQTIIIPSSVFVTYCDKIVSNDQLCIILKVFNFSIIFYFRVIK